jgi:hypothetical protein
MTAPSLPEQIADARSDVQQAIDLYGMARYGSHAEALALHAMQLHASRLGRLLRDYRDSYPAAAIKYDHAQP